MAINIEKYPDITKKAFVDNYIKSFDVHPVPNPTAIFMAGLPGSGKTEFSKNLVSIIKDKKPVRIDMDEIASQIKGYTPKEADKFREPATRLLNGILDKVLKQKVEFILDGTFGSRNSIKNIKRAINHGYTIRIIYIIQEPKIAWHFTEMREKVEHRSITLEGFVETYFNIIKNITEITPLIENNDKIILDIISKDKNTAIGLWQANVKKEIDKYTNLSYNTKTLKEYLHDR